MVLVTQLTDTNIFVITFQYISNSINNQRVVSSYIGNACHSHLEQRCSTVVWWYVDINLELDICVSWFVYVLSGVKHLTILEELEFPNDSIYLVSYKVSLG